MTEGVQLCHLILSASVATFVLRAPKDITQYIQEYCQDKKLGAILFEATTD